jgi:pyridoxal phosphate enzyme (YggS family)
MTSSLTTRFYDITLRMEAARKTSLLAAKQVALIAVSKAHSAEAMLPLLQAGHRIFGENKVQEAEAKWPALREQFPDIELHLIGSLQSNKAREALTLFDVIETIDRPSLVEAIAKERAKASLRCQRFFLQVNIGEEQQKGGVLPAGLAELLTLCNSHNLPIAGLMCVPPSDENPAPYFALLHKLAAEHGILELSMGMSGDFETAIRFGATHVRVGTALFGER